MRKTLITTSMVLLGSLVASSAFADSLIIYPSEGQSATQQREDKVSCQMWATDTTGVDPVEIAQSDAPSQAEIGGERRSGAVKGALGGALIGAIAGDAGKGAAIGAGAGVLHGESKKRRKQDYNEAQADRADASRHSQMNKFNRAFTACMEGRGYSVS